MTLRMGALSAMTPSITALSITTFYTMPLSITILSVLALSTTTFYTIIGTIFKATSTTNFNKTPSVKTILL